MVACFPDFFAGKNTHTQAGRCERSAGIRVPDRIMNKISSGRGDNEKID
jgi:hypothetical protein